MPANSHKLSAQTDVDLGRMLMRIGWKAPVNSLPEEGTSWETLGQDRSPVWCHPKSMGKRSERWVHVQRWSPPNAGQTRSLLSPTGNPPQHRQLGPAMPLGPNPNPGLGSQASIHRGLATSPPDWGQLSHSAGFHLPPRRKTGCWEMRETLRAGEACTPTSGHSHLQRPLLLKEAGA